MVQPISFSPVSSSQLMHVSSFLQTLAAAVAKVAHLIAAPFIALHNWVRPMNPVTLKREFQIVPTCFENFIGRAVYNSLVVKSGGEIFEDNQQYGHYVQLVQEIGKELVEKCPRKGLSFEFKVIDSEQVNAWCLPGGKIGVNLGLIKKMERETDDFELGKTLSLKEKLAAVIGHEITHAAARHGGRGIEFRLFLLALIQGVKYATAYFFFQYAFREDIEKARGDRLATAKIERKKQEMVQNFGFVLNPVSNILFNGLSLCGTRRHELEADKYGMHLMKQAELDPIAALWVMHYFKKHHNTKSGIGWLDRIREFFHTHPSAEERLAANQKTLQELQG